LVGWITVWFGYIVGIIDTDSQLLGGVSLNSDVNYDACLNWSSQPRKELGCRWGGGFG
jgi:hypothetical protein